MPESQDSIFILYKVHDIQKVENGFVIVLHDEAKDRYYDVASAKTGIKIKRKIIKGQNYLFQINPYFEKYYLPNHSVVYSVKIKNKTIKVRSNGWTFNVYTSPNLDGLYYIPPEKAKHK